MTQVLFYGGFFAAIKIMFVAAADTIMGPSEVRQSNHNCSGSHAAEIMDNYGNSILRLEYSYLHNTADAEDILQETLIRYLQKAPTFESSGHEKA